MPLLADTLRTTRWAGQKSGCSDSATGGSVEQFRGWKGSGELSHSGSRPFLFFLHEIPLVLRWSAHRAPRAGSLDRSCAQSCDACQPLPAPPASLKPVLPLHPPSGPRHFLFPVLLPHLFFLLPASLSAGWLFLLCHQRLPRRRRQNLGGEVRPSLLSSLARVFSYMLGVSPGTHADTIKVHQLL